MIDWGGRGLFLAAALLLAAAGLLALLPGLGAPGAWSPGGPDAPEPPLADFLFLWIAGAAALILSLRSSGPAKPAWAALCFPRLGPALLACAAWLALTEWTGSLLVGLLLLTGVRVLLGPASTRFIAARPPVPDAAYKLAEAGIGLIVGAVSLSVAVLMPPIIRQIGNLGPSDAPWLSFWVFIAFVVLQAIHFRRTAGRNPWFLFAMGWGAAATIHHNWTVSGLNIIAIMTGLVTLILLPRVTRGPKHPKPAA